MIQSMTAYASRTGSFDTTNWQWEMRGVNARGLDIRLRIPDGLEGLDQTLRKQIKSTITRGNIAISLRLTQDDASQSLELDEEQLDRVLSALDTVQDRAFSLGVTLGQPTAADVLSHKGVVIARKSGSDEKGMVKALTKDFEQLLAEFVEMRKSEGLALSAVISTQIGQIEALTTSAATAADARKPAAAQQVKNAFTKVLDDFKDVDEDRLAQELAALAIKQDVTEEIDRLKAHVIAAQAMVSDPKPLGRKMDFLAQEFNREANTLCSKAQDADLTAIGLDLKAVIDQMREQIQNVE